ncbi:hypothetical protein ACFXJ8_03880 [Nonomuraea sp. NPDC059194]|uniref:hypothetical protein n=1 Tax=Nonomuraea sp. NPDC059194 TaxID=3346764 RepID=UPI0036C686C4
MSIKDVSLRLATVLENELIQIRADQMEAAEALTNRINGVGERVKRLDAKVTTLVETMDAKVATLDEKVTTMDAKVTTMDEKVTTMDAKVVTLQDTQTQMLEILIDVQRRLPS